MWNTVLFCCCVFITVYATAGAIPGYYTEDDCKNVKNAVWNNVSQTCDCQPDHVVSGDLTRCLPVVAAGYDTACEENVQCSATMGPGAACVERQCPGSACGKIQCVCTNGYHFLHGVCRRSVGYSEVCTGRDGECYGSYSFESMTCQQGLCRCAPGYYERGPGECWWIATEEGEDCLNDKDCAFDGGFCNKTSREEWLCNRPAESSSGLSRPGPASRLGSKCSSDNSTCGQHEMCLLGSCVCQLGYFAVNGTCLPELGVACDEANCTHIESAKCRSGKCSCVAPYVIGDDNRSCRIGRRFDITCQLDAQCRLSGGLAECANRICSCTAGSHYDQDEELCWPSKGLGTPCSGNKDCVVDMGTAECHNDSKTCVCSGDLLPSKTSCIPQVQEIGDLCVQDADCTQVINNSTCKENKCQCATGYLKDPHSTNTCLVGLDGPCADNSSCSAVPWSVCVGNTCQCNNSFVPSQTNELCLNETEDIGGPCMEDQQCHLMGENALCGGPDVGCTCAQGFYFRESFCREKRSLGQECKDNLECYLGSGKWDNVYCLNGICHCRYGTVQTPDSKDCTNTGLRSGTSQGAVIAILVVGRLLAAAW